MEVLRSGWHDYLLETLTPLYTACDTEQQYQDVCLEFETFYPDWKIQEEQLLLYWIYTYFCGAVYDEQIFAKVKMAVICTFMIHELAMGTWLLQQSSFPFQIWSQSVTVFPGSWNTLTRILIKWKNFLIGNHFSLENLLEI